MANEYIGFEKELILIDHLLSGGVVTQEYIVKEFLVCKKTASRYISRIRDIAYMLNSIDVIYTEGKRGKDGYSGSLRLKKK